MPIPSLLTDVIASGTSRPASGGIARALADRHIMTIVFMASVMALTFVPAVTLADGTCNLIIAGPVYVNGGTGTVFALESNAPYVYVRNVAGSSPATEVLFTVSDNPSWSCRVPVPALGTGGQATITASDPTIRQLAGGSVTYTATVDPDNLVPETDESNQMSTARDVKYNGYKGAHYWTGKGNITTHKTYDLHGDMIYSFGNSSYKSGSFGAGGWNSYAVNWTAANLTIPAGATVKDVRLYVAYTWDNSNVVPGHMSIDFNGVRVPYEHWESDESNFGGYDDYWYGLLTYNVTELYRKNALNEALFARDNPTAKISPYGMMLAVVYEDPSATRKQIFLNEGFDLLGASVGDYGTTEEEATAYVEFSGMSIDLSQAVRANLITFCPSGAAQDQIRPGEGNLFVNGVQVGHDVWSYGPEVTGEGGGSQVAVDVRDVKTYLNPTGGNNLIGMQSTAGATPCMAAAYEFLVVEYPSPVFAVSLVSGWNLVSWPVGNSTLHASDLVNNQSLGISLVTRYSVADQSFSSYFKGANPAKDFAMTPDSGYFVKAAAATGFVVTGEPLSGHYVGVSRGWNLAGWSSYHSVYASDVLADADFLSLATSYSPSGGFNSYFRGANPSKNFMLTAGNGYFVKSTSVSEQQLYIG